MNISTTIGGGKKGKKKSTNKISVFWCKCWNQKPNLKQEIFLLLIEKALKLGTCRDCKEFYVKC